MSEQQVQYSLASGGDCPSEKRYTIAVDFDGVIHRYDSPWVDHHVIPDPPVEGAIEWLNAMAKRFKVVIFTTRGKTRLGRLAVTDYLLSRGFDAPFEVTAVKPPALVYIDDRAWRFEGRFPSAHEIHSARPWHKRREVLADGEKPLSDTEAELSNVWP